MTAVPTGIKTAAAGMKQEQPKKTHISRSTMHFRIKDTKISGIIKVLSMLVLNSRQV